MSIKANTNWFAFEVNRLQHLIKTSLPTSISSANICPEMADRIKRHYSDCYIMEINKEPSTVTRPIATTLCAKSGWQTMNDKFHAKSNRKGKCVDSRRRKNVERRHLDVVRSLWLKEFNKNNLMFISSADKQISLFDCDRSDLKPQIFTTIVQCSWFYLFCIFKRFEYKRT